MIGTNLAFPLDGFTLEQPQIALLLPDELLQQALLHEEPLDEYLIAKDLLAAIAIILGVTPLEFTILVFIKFGPAQIGVRR